MAEILSVHGGTKQADRHRTPDGFLIRLPDGLVYIQAPAGEKLTTERANYLLDKAKQTVLADG
jgi:hypothetical protein